MSATVSSTFPFYLKQVAIYIGSPILITGVFGGLLNIIVFLSLQTFRQNSCAFYLTIMSFANVGMLLVGMLPRIMISGFSIDWTVHSSFCCKATQFCVQVCALISITCLCLATIDQYLATCSHPRCQQWSNIKIARRLSAITVLFWLLHGILCLVYFNLIPLVTTGTIICGITNAIYLRYFTYGYTAIFTGYLPVSITILFGLLAYHNVRRLAYRAVPLARRELDKQLTVMVLILDIYNIIALMPYPIIIVLTSVTTITQNPSIADHINFISSLTTYSYYLYYAVNMD